MVEVEPEAAQAQVDLRLLPLVRTCPSGLRAELCRDCWIGSLCLLCSPLPTVMYGMEAVVRAELPEETLVGGRLKVM